MHLLLHADNCAWQSPVQLTRPVASGHLPMHASYPESHLLVHCSRDSCANRSLDVRVPASLDVTPDSHTRRTTMYLMSKLTHSSLRKPFADLGMPVRGIVVDDRVDRLSLGNVRVNLIEEADEFLMPMALHVAADYGAVENIERGEQRGRAVALVIVRHRSGATRLHRQSRLGAIESLDLALLVDREDDGVGGRVDIETDHI